MKASHIILLIIILYIFSSCQETDSEWIKIDSIPVDSITAYNIDSICDFDEYLPFHLYNDTPYCNLKEYNDNPPFCYQKDYSDAWHVELYMIDNAADFELFTTLKSTDYSIDFSKNIFVFCKFLCSPLAEPYFQDSYLEYRYDMGEKYYRYSIKLPTLEDEDNSYCILYSLEAWNIYPKEYMQAIKNIYYIYQIIPSINSTPHE